MNFPTRASWLFSALLFVLFGQNMSEVVQGQEYPSEFLEKCRRKLSYANRAALEKLCESNDPSMSLFAAWELACHGYLSEQPSPGTVSWSVRANRFLDQVEIVAGKPPVWWSKTIRQGKLDSFGFNGGEYQEHEFSFPTDASRIGILEKGWKIAEHDESIVVTSPDGKSIPVHKTIVSSLPSDRRYILVAGQCEDFVVLATDGCDAGITTLMRCDSKKILWKTTPWADGVFGIYFAKPAQRMRAELRIRGSQVCYFGSGHRGSHLDIYDLDTGTATLHFHTNYWCSVWFERLAGHIEDFERER